MHTDTCVVCNMQLLISCESTEEGMICANNTHYVCVVCPLIIIIIISKSTGVRLFAQAHAISTRNYRAANLAQRIWGERFYDFVTFKRTTHASGAASNDVIEGDAVAMTVSDSCHWARSLCTHTRGAFIGQYVRCL